MARRHDARGSPRSARRLSWSKVSRSGRSVDGSGGAVVAAPVLLFLVVPAPAPGALALPVAADCSVSAVFSVVPASWAWSAASHQSQAPSAPTAQATTPSAAKRRVGGVVIASRRRVSGRRCGAACPLASGEQDGELRHVASASASGAASVFFAASSAVPGPACGAGACQPQAWPSFCCLSHSCSGAKYSSTAEPSICSLPVSSFIVSCHGWLAPLSSIAQNFCPATLLS